MGGCYYSSVKEPLDEDPYLKKHGFEREDDEAGRFIDQAEALLWQDEQAFLDRVDERVAENRRLNRPFHKPVPLFINEDKHIPVASSVIDANKPKKS